MTRNKIQLKDNMLMVIANNDVFFIIPKLPNIITKNKKRSAPKI